MKKHLQYANYLFRHKWFVFLGGLRTGAPLWRLIIHDWSKFLPGEWRPYAEYFYGKKLNGGYFHQPGNDDKFDRAWLAHIHRNPHHWQYWILREDEGNTKYLDMPEHFVREMVADWLGAGRTQTGRWGVHDWYGKNRDMIRISDRTRNKVEDILVGL